MKSKRVEQILDDAAYKVVWGDYKPKYEWLAEYVPGSMMAEDWDPIEMFGFERMAHQYRDLYGFNELLEPN
jgi:hypothetical protein